MGCRRILMYSIVKLTCRGGYVKQIAKVFILVGQPCGTVVLSCSSCSLCTFLFQNGAVRRSTCTEGGFVKYHRTWKLVTLGAAWPATARESSKGDCVLDVMQPGRPFLRSLQSSLLKRVRGKVHCENETSRERRRRQRRSRPERVDPDPREPPLERRDIAHRVLAAARACSMVDPAKVTEDADFEELELEKGDVVVLVLAVLKEYGLSLSYVEARKMTTCTEVIDHIESQVRQDDSSRSGGH